MPQAEALKTKTWPVSEIFGPTIQGEGPDAGRPCYFIRLGGCDYQHCSWCDTLHAVLPEEVRKLDRQDSDAIMRTLKRLHDGPSMVVLSGGNPAIHDLSSLVAAIQEYGLEVAVETQGSRWQDWLENVERLVISPKPPSSGMANKAHEHETTFFMQKVENWCYPSPYEQTWVALKIVIFDEEDYEWALDFGLRYPWVPLYLSVGTPQVEGVAIEEITRDYILSRFRWLSEKAMNDIRARHAKVLPQLHVLAFGTGRGV